MSNEYDPEVEYIMEQIYVGYFNMEELGIVFDADHPEFNDVDDIVKRYVEQHKNAVSESELPLHKVAPDLLLLVAVRLMRNLAVGAYKVWDGQSDSDRHGAWRPMAKAARQLTWDDRVIRPAWWGYR